MGKGKKHLNSNVTRIKQYMAERNILLTAEDISNSLGMTKSYSYTILDLMRALDVVDKVRIGSTYYYLKGEHGEEQLNLMLNQRNPPITPRTHYRMEEYDPIIDKFIESGERLVEIIVEDRQTSYVKTILEKRIRERGIEGEVAASSVGEWLYLERTNLREVK